MISAGRVLPMPKGDYNALTTYEYLDIVSDNGNSYILKVDTSTGNPPTDTTKWQLLAYGGSAANVAANFAVVETTQYASQAYKVGDFLVDKDSKLCRVTAAILQGSEIIIGTNVEVTSVTALVRTVEESIAVVETKIASYSHDIGDHFYLSDVLYKATAAIQAGDTLTSGTNITPAVDVCTQINELASDTETAIQGVKDLLAPSEDGSTAVLSYSIGDEFIRNGALCKAKTAITSGDTLVFNTNYEDAGVAMDQLVSLNEALSNEVVTRATLGTSNLDVPINEEAYYATYSRSNNGYQVISTVSGAWTNVCFYYKLPKNKDIKILTTVSHSAGTPRIAVYGNSIPSETGRTSITTKEISADGAVEVSFNTGNYEYIAVALFASINIAAQGDVTYANFIIKLSNDPNTSYTEPAMTNRELTDARFLNGTVTQVANANFTDSAEYTIPSDGWYNLWLQINEVAAGKGLAIKLGSGAGASSISTLRTSGQMYEGANAIIPLKAGTVVTFTCSESTLSCQYNVKRIS